MSLSRVLPRLFCTVEAGLKHSAPLRLTPSCSRIHTSHTLPSRPLFLKQCLQQRPSCNTLPSTRHISQNPDNTQPEKLLVSQRPAKKMNRLKIAIRGCVYTQITLVLFNAQSFVSWQYHDFLHFGDYTVFPMTLGVCTLMLIPYLLLFTRTIGRLELDVKSLQIKTSTLSISGVRQEKVHPIEACKFSPTSQVCHLSDGPYLVDWRLGSDPDVVRHLAKLTSDNKKQTMQLDDGMKAYLLLVHCVAVTTMVTCAYIWLSMSSEEREALKDTLSASKMTLKDSIEKVGV